MYISEPQKELNNLWKMTTIENNKSVVNSITDNTDLTNSASDVGKVYYNPETKELYVWTVDNGTYEWTSIKELLNLS